MKSSHMAFRQIRLGAKTVPGGFKSGVLVKESVCDCHLIAESRSDEPGIEGVEETSSRLRQ
jgi:hypothetical protein